MKIEELKGCPWCGCKPSTVSVSVDCWQTYCGNVECVAEVSVMGLTSEKSMRIWNEMAAGQQPEAIPNAGNIAGSVSANGSVDYKHKWEITIEADSTRGAMDAVWQMWIAWRDGDEPIGLTCPSTMGNRVSSRVKKVH